MPQAYTTTDSASLDAREVPTSCSNRTALDLYEKALTQYQSYVGDPLATIDEALKHSPDFILGHVFKAVAIMMMTEQRFVADARASVERGKTFLPQANSRERNLLAAAAILVDGDWDAACASFDRVLVEYPRDAFAIQSAHLMDFYRGDSLNLRNRLTRVLPHWNADLSGYSYILGMHAFGLEECNQYAEAEDVGRRALALQPKDGWAVHAVTHVMEMQGRIDDGIQWLKSRKEDWAPNNSFAFHNWWHLALFYLDRGRFKDVLSIFDAEIHPAPPDFILQLLDATSLLWRLYLEQADVGDRAQTVADGWSRRLDSERGFYAFNDLHALMAFVLAGREREADYLMGNLEWTAQHGAGTNLMMTRDVGLPLSRGVLAFGQGRYNEAIAWIEPVRDIAHRFGGSHAQRDVLTLTLIEAAIRSGRRQLAEHYIAERTMLKSGDHWGPRLLRRARA